MSTGMLSRRLRSWRSGRQAGCIVLCYHRVTDDTNDHWQNAVSASNFNDHMRIVRNRYEIVPIGHVADALIAGRRPARKTVAITFDDGYAVNMAQACDILVRSGMPATFYLNTAWLDRERFWWDELVDMVGRDGNYASRIETCRARFKAIDDETRETELRALRTTRPTGDRAGCRPMTRADVRVLADEPLFTIGAHTHSHPSLACVPEARQRAEIGENKRVLEDLCNRPVTHFSYPFGGPSDFDDVTVSELRAAGFKSAATTSASALRWPGDPYRIPRLSVKNWDARKFAAKLQHLWAT